MAKKPASKPEKKLAAQTSMLPAEKDMILVVAVAEIQVDTRQPRTDDEEKTSNVSGICETLVVDADGIARPVHPVQVRKTPPWAEDQSRPWMIFDGECRYLGATIKGASGITCHVVEFPEAEVHERQVLTAMVRRPLGPTAQLNAIKTFDEAHPGVNAENAAVRLGIPAKSIRSLRKLVALPPDVRARFMCNEHTLEVCESISRIEGVTSEERSERQSLASKAVAGMAPKKAREYIASQFLLRLATAPFDREDANLNPEAGVCSACPHRTGAQTALFGETDEAEDCCTRHACWNEKASATVAKSPPPDEQKPKAKPVNNKPTKDDVVVAALLAAGAEAEELDAKVAGKTREEIDASLERLAAAGNPKARPALQDRHGKGVDLGGYSRGSAWAIGDAALHGVRDAIERLGGPDLSVFLRNVAAASGGLLTFAERADVTISPLACEPGDEPPPPPPVAPDDPWLDEPLTPDEEAAFAAAEKEDGVPWT